MPFDDQFRETVRAKSELATIAREYGVQFRSSGGRLTARCPFHADNTPSFSVSTQLGLYHCFGCGASGDVFTFVQQMDKLEFPEALALLAGRAGLPMPEEQNDKEYAARRAARENAQALNKLAARYYYDTLFSPPGQSGLAYLRGRGLGDAALRRFGVGYAPDDADGFLRLARQKSYSVKAVAEAGLARINEFGTAKDMFRGRVMFPIINERNVLVGFGGRIMGDGQPKYLNSPQTPLFDKQRCLFGLNRAKARPKEQPIIIVEGYMDVLALHQQGFEGAVASLGTAFGAEHSKLLKRFCTQVVVCFDGDGAGTRAALASFGHLARSDITVRVLRLSGAKDPDEFIQKQGRDAFATALEAALSVPDFRILLAQENNDLRTSQGRAAFAADAAAVLGDIPSPAAREEHLDRWLPRLSAQTGISPQALFEEVSIALAKQKVHAGSPRSAHATGPPGTADKPSPAERQTLAILYEGGLEAKPWLEQLEEKDFAHPIAQKLLSALKEANGDPAAVPLFAWEETERDQAISVIMENSPPPGAQRAQMLAQLLAALRRESLDRTGAQILARIQQATPEELPALLQTLDRVTKDLAQLKAQRNDV